MEFIRYGNLTPQYHEIPADPDDRSFHTPPVEYGIYAFPKGFIETFLIGGTGSGSTQNGRRRYMRDASGNKMMMTCAEFTDYQAKHKKIAKRLALADKDGKHIYAEYAEEDDENKYFLMIENEPTRFKYNGLIWHHLYIDDGVDKYAKYYIRREDTWVLTDMKTYKKCLDRAVARHKHWQTLKAGEGWGESTRQLKERGIPIPPYQGAPGPRTKDEYEVFIENIQNENKRYRQ